MNNENKETKLKLFNLDRALAGDKVISRDGSIKPYDFKCWSQDTLEKSLFGYFSGEILSFYSDGSHEGYGIESNFDLFMAPIKKQGWVNVYLNTLTRELSSSRCSYETKQSSIYNCFETESFKLIDTVMIEWEE